MFSQVSVCPQGGVCLWSWGVCLPLPPGRRPLCRHPRQTPPGRHPLGRHPSCPVHAGIHPPAQCMLGYTHPPVQCILGYTPHPVNAGIWSTSGRYASNWNAFLFRKYVLKCDILVILLFKIRLPHCDKIKSGFLLSCCVWLQKI